MCTYQTERIEITGSGKGAGGWFALHNASVYFDHPVHAPADHTLNLDFLNPQAGQRPGWPWSWTERRLRSWPMPSCGSWLRRRICSRSARGHRRLPSRSAPAAQTTRSHSKGVARS